MDLTDLNKASILSRNKERLFLGAYGFEDRTLGWLEHQIKKENYDVISCALMFKYASESSSNRSPNKISELRAAIERLGCQSKAISEIPYNWEMPWDLEYEIEEYFTKNLRNIDEVVIDISTMSKFLILVCLLKLHEFGNCSVRIVYSQAIRYSPTFKEYQESKKDMAFLTKYPSQGVAAIARAKCLSSIRMQGQPTTLITFTSFNEQLVRHLLGTMNPHKLIFINGRPPEKRMGWREKATQKVHQKLIDSFLDYNLMNDNGMLINSTSTLQYVETYDLITKIYSDIGMFERIIIGATGSKMQTVALFFLKLRHPDIHIEYPTPNSYYIEGLSNGVKEVYEIVLSNI